MDVVGLDTLGHVVHTLDEHLKDDPWHVFFTLPAWLKQLVESGHLGQKTGQGIYRKRGKSLEVYDISLGDYRPVQTGVSDEIKAIFKLKTPSEQIAALRASDTPEAELIRSCWGSSTFFIFK